MSSNATNLRRVVEHLPWLAPHPRSHLMAPGVRPSSPDKPGFRLRLGRDIRVGGEGTLLGQAPDRAPWVPFGSALVAGTVLRFEAVSTGYEDPCGGIDDESLVFVVEGGSLDGFSVAIYARAIDDTAVAEALAIVEVRDRE